MPIAEHREQVLAGRGVGKDEVGPVEEEQDGAVGPGQDPPLDECGQVPLRSLEGRPVGVEVGVEAQGHGAARARETVPVR